MKKHLKYLRYLLRHKWYVARACFRRGLYWQGIVHDWSKFLPSEWAPYAESFYGRGAELRIFKTGSGLAPIEERELNKIKASFDAAWLAHQHRSPHHWQHWVLREDSGATKILPMPEKYRLEMLADWEGAGRAITGKKGGTPAWYMKNREQIQLNQATRALVEADLGITDAMSGAERRAFTEGLVKNN